MKPEQLEKVIPLSLISVFIVLISLRALGVIPSVLATDEFEISRTIFIDAGIGGLLAVLAIVISLSLMGVQFASQEYTHRVMNTYIKSFMLWSMIGIYIVTILYNLYMTAFLVVPINTIYADISVFLQSLCLIMLIPHFIISVIHLRPDFTIGIIMRSIDKEYISSIEPFFSEADRQVPSNIDRLLPAVEIVGRSVQRGDGATVRMALEEINTCFGLYVNPQNEDWAARYFLNYLLRIGREAVIEADDDSLVQVLRILSNIGCSTSSANVTLSIIEYIGIIGLGALKKDFEAPVEQMVDSFQQILRADLGDEISGRIFDSFYELSEQLFVLEKKRLIRYLLNRLSGLSEPMVSKQNNAMVIKWAEVLEEIGRNVIKRNQRRAAHDSINAYYLMGTLAAKSEWDISRYIIEPLIRMEREVAPDDRELLAEIEYAKKEIEESTRKYITKGKEEINIETSDLW